MVISVTKAERSPSWGQSPTVLARCGARLPWDQCSCSLQGPGSHSRTERAGPTLGAFGEAAATRQAHRHAQSPCPRSSTRGGGCSGPAQPHLQLLLGWLQQTPRKHLPKKAGTRREHPPSNRLLPSSILKDVDTAVSPTVPLCSGHDTAHAAGRARRKSLHCPDPLTGGSANYSPPANPARQLFLQAVLWESRHVRSPARSVSSHTYPQTEGLQKTMSDPRSPKHLLAGPGPRKFAGLCSRQP